MMSPQPIVVAGGGIIGAATAYYLSLKGKPVMVVEATRIACSASGKAGGFLALDWCDSSQIGPLARKSFELHKEIATEFGAEEIGYRTMTTHSLALQNKQTKRRGMRGRGLPQWIQGNVVQSSVIGTTDNTAQVHPEKLTKALLKAAQERAGSSVVEGTAVVGLVVEENVLCGVKTKDMTTGAERVIHTDTVVFALGAWSATFDTLLPKGVENRVPAVEGLKVHSIVVDDSSEVSTADALFLSYEDSSGVRFDPEM